MYGIVTDKELELIDQERESMDSLDWRSPNYESEEYDRYGWPIEEDEAECDGNETESDGM